MALIFAAGLALLLYPTVSDVWNKMHQSPGHCAVHPPGGNAGPGALCGPLGAGRSLQPHPADNPDRFQDPEAQLAACEQLLVVSDTDVIGTLEIPGIGVYAADLPRHQRRRAAGRQWAMWRAARCPPAARGTHCVLSGHRGLPSARLLTDLDDLIVGDTFTLTVLDRTMTYQVDQILTVLPYEMEALAI